MWPQIHFQIAGKDDKYWGGHYGPIMSTSVIRIQRESKSDENDQFEDVQEVYWFSNSCYSFSIFWFFNKYLNIVIFTMISHIAYFSHSQMMQRPRQQKERSWWPKL